MANEITVTGSLTVNKPTVMQQAQGESFTNLTFTMTGNAWIGGYLAVQTSATLIPVANVTAPHWAFFKNLDLTNYLTIRNGIAGADVIQLYPGEPTLVALLQTGTYYAVANTAICVLQYLIFSF